MLDLVKHCMMTEIDDNYSTSFKIG